MFIQPNRAKAKLQAGQPIYGVIATSDDPQTAELAGLAGFDYYILDAEHGLLDPAQTVNVVRACERAQITPLVRLGSRDLKWLLPYLDAGMMGVMLPGLTSAAEVADLVQAVKYPPLGRRGVGLSRASAYMAYGGQAPAYLEFANTHTLVMPQFEDADLLAVLPAMLAVPGVDALMIGPRDLSLTMGYPDGPHHPAVQAVIDQVIARGQQAGVPVGLTANTRAEAERHLQRGARLILASAQALFLAGASAVLPA